MMEWGVNHGILQKAKLENAIVAAKSGTTNDYKDGWLAGYSNTIQLLYGLAATGLNLCLDLEEELSLLIYGKIYGNNT